MATHSADDSGTDILGPRIIVAGFDGWNDAGEAATGAITTLREAGDYTLVHSVDPELYFDYQYNRPTVSTAPDGARVLTWPSAQVWRPPSADEIPDAESSSAPELWVLSGVEPARAWKAFASEFIDVALQHDITGLVVLGSLMSDVPHTRPITVFASSDDPEVRAELDLEGHMEVGES